MTEARFKSVEKFYLKVSICMLIAMPALLLVGLFL
ncbi:hypothetical protein RSK20926_21120 [Roseobacter sp. SK209-2-6]|nr:hypothetical protein RSK20926_21120 [Roseobacter sp. SK209-2-6]